MASSAPSLSKTSNPPLSSSSRLIPHQPQFMQIEGSPRHHRHQHQPYEKKLAGRKIQNNQLGEENLMPINFSSSSSTNSEMEVKSPSSTTAAAAVRNRRKSSRILRGLTSALMSYPVLKPAQPAQAEIQEPMAMSDPSPNISQFPSSNSNYHLKWDDHVNSTVSAIQCLLATETFVDVTLVCDEEEEIGGCSDLNLKRRREEGMMNGDYSRGRGYKARRNGSRERRYRPRGREEDEDVDSFADDEENDDSDLTRNNYQIKFKAHKVILSTCSEYFRKIFSENPCKHPVIVLKDFQPWEVRSLLDFMYKGQVILRPERLETLIKAADSLQIRGLRECIEKSEEWVRLKRGAEAGESSDNEVESLEAKIRVLNRTSDNTKLSTGPPALRPSQVDNESGPSFPKLLNLSMDGSPSHLIPPRPIQPSGETNGPQTSIVQQTGGVKSSHHNHQTNPTSASPPFPRRKQARPRRRSGDFVAQDLRITVTPPLQIPPTSHGPEYTAATPHDFHLHNNSKIHDFNPGMKGAFERPAHLNHLISSHFLKNWQFGAGIGSPVGTPPLPHALPMKHHDLDFDDASSSPPDRFRSPPGTPDSSSPMFESKQFPGDVPLFHEPIPGMGFKASPPSPSFFLGLNNGHPLLSGGGHHSDESNNPESASTPPSVFSPAGFSHGGGESSGRGGGNHNSNSHHAQQWPGLPMGPAPIFGRHRAQHSAPRGGPPRAWSNADLTEALHNVWNKKMTTSQASRIFGIPYNSLLMYVRGKYGKSLKLDLLKKGLDLALENSNNNGGGSLNSNGSLVPTLISNNNNNNNNSTSPANPKSKSSASHPHPHHPHHASHYPANLEDSPPSGLTLTSTTHAHGAGDPQDLIPSGFNPFSSIFGDYPPPFPFPPSLSHILPSVNHLSAAASVEKVNPSRRNNNNDGDK